MFSSKKNEWLSFFFSLQSFFNFKDLILFQKSENTWRIRLHLLSFDKGQVLIFFFFIFWPLLFLIWNIFFFFFCNYSCLLFKLFCLWTSFTFNQLLHKYEIIFFLNFVHISILFLFLLACSQKVSPNDLILLYMTRLNSFEDFIYTLNPLPPPPK